MDGGSNAADSEHHGSRTILFFGDSNTRGYGVGRQQRFAAVLETALAARGHAAWRCVVGHAPSDFRSFARRLDYPMETFVPDILVWQCPTGPAAYFVRYPEWITRLATFHNRWFNWRRARYIRADMRAGGEGRTRREALYEGRYLNRLYGLRPARWPGIRQARRLLAARYGTRVKATRERYLELASAARDQLRARTGAPILFLGLFPHSDESFPGYTARIAEWNGYLARLLHQPDAGLLFLDVANGLHPGSDQLLFSDGMHLSIEAHRRVAEIILPIVIRLIDTVETATADYPATYQPSV